MAAFNKFNAYVASLANGSFNQGSDTLKVMLSNTLPTASNSTTSDITEISAGSGYSAGGAAVTSVTSTQTSGLYKLIGTGPTFTSSGTIGPFRYVVLYDAGNSKLIGWWDYGSSITLNNAETFAVNFDPTNGILQIQ